MSKIQPHNSKEIIKQAIFKYKSRLKLAFLYSGISHILFLFTLAYILQVMDRMIGSYNLYTLYIIVGIAATICVICTALQILINFRFKEVEKWVDSETTLSTDSLNNINSDFVSFKLLFSSAQINLMLDGIWSILYFIFLFLIHPYMGFAAILGVLIVVGFSCLQRIITKKNLRGVTEFNSKGISWLYVIRQNAELFVMSSLFLPFMLAGYISYILNSELKKADKYYINNNLSKFILFLKVLLNTICKLIVLHGITGIGAYIVVSTNAVEMTVGGMLASVIITNKLLNIFDNLVPRWRCIFSLSSRVLESPNR